MVTHLLIFGRSCLKFPTVIAGPHSLGAPWHGAKELSSHLLPSGYTKGPNGLPSYKGESHGQLARSLQVDAFGVYSGYPFIWVLIDLLIP